MTTRIVVEHGDLVSATNLKVFAISHTKGRGEEGDEQTVAEAGTVAPGEVGTFYVHHGQDLLVTEEQ